MLLSLSAIFYALKELVLDINGKRNLTIEKISLFTFGFTFYSLVGFLVWVLLSAFDLVPWLNKDNLNYGIIIGSFLWILIILFYFMIKTKSLDAEVNEFSCKVTGAISGFFWGAFTGLIIAEIYADTYNLAILIIISGLLTGVLIGTYMGFITFPNIPNFNEKFKAHIYVLISIGFSALLWILLSVIIVMFLLWMNE